MIPTVNCISVFRNAGCISLFSVVGSMSKSLLPCTWECKALCSSEASSSGPSKAPAEKPVSKAMRAYIQRAKDYEEFLKKENLDYKLGKRHLANMMGEDPEEFTQEDVNRAIEYLFPSGLFDPKARPFMKPPEEVFPPQKAAQFDESGRPFTSFFYTGKSNFYKVLYDTVEHLYELNDIEDKMIRKHLSPDPSKALDLNGSEWLPQEVLEHRLVEKLHTSDYTSFIAVFTRLASHPYSYRVSDYIMEYRKPLLSQTAVSVVPEPSYDAAGRAYVTVESVRRKSSSARVTVWGQGSGKITINGQNLKYFRFIQEREQFHIYGVHVIDLLREAVIASPTMKTTTAAATTTTTTSPEAEVRAAVWKIATLDQLVVFVCRNLRNSDTSHADATFAQPVIFDKEFRQCFFYIGGSICHKFLKMAKRYHSNKKRQAIGDVIEKKILEDGFQENFLQQLIENRKWTERRNRGELQFVKGATQEFLLSVAKIVAKSEQSDGSLPNNKKHTNP